MERSRTARRLAAAALAFHVGVALTLWGAAGAEAGSGGSCDGVTGRLVDHGTTVTGVFDVPSTCEEVSVLSWFAAGPNGEQPQQFLDRIGHDNVAPGHYEWTITAPPPECFRQLDLRVPGRNVDSIVGGEHECQPTPPPPSGPVLSKGETNGGLTKTMLSLMGKGAAGRRSKKIATPTPPRCRNNEARPARIRRVLEVCRPEKLTVNPDCGFGWSPRYMCNQKLRALAAGAQLVRRQLAGK